MKNKWFAKDGHVFSEQTKIKKNKDFRLGENYVSQVVIAYNVGESVSKHIVALHNASLE